jgi:hypothetical protein
MRLVVPIALSVVATIIVVVVTSLIARSVAMHAPEMPVEEPS